MTFNRGAQRGNLADSLQGDFDSLCALCEAVAAKEGAIVSVQQFSRGESNILLESQDVVIPLKNAGDVRSPTVVDILPPLSTRSSGGF